MCPSYVKTEDERDILERWLKDPDLVDYLTQWIDYVQNGNYRLKMLHDIRLHDGTVLERMRPNASMWFQTRGRVKISDDEVAFIRLSVNQEY